MSPPVRSTAILVAVLGLLMGFSIGGDSHAHAQTLFERWTNPRQLLKSPPKDTGQIPYVMTGPSNRTHAVFFGRPDTDATGPITLYYAHWQSDGGLSEPADVVVNPEGGVPAMVTAVEDLTGQLHVFWAGNQLWYTHVFVNQAHDARAWSKPHSLLDTPASYIGATLGTDGQIHVAVTSLNRAVYYLRVTAQGAVEFSTIVYQISATTYSPYDVSVAVTKSDVVHVCWDEFDWAGDTRAKGVYCTSSRDRGNAWPSPQQVVTGHRGATLFYFSQTDELMRIIWGGNGVGGRSVQFYAKDRDSWNAPLDLEQGIRMDGFNGQLAAMDAGGTIHVLVNPGDGRYYHSRLQQGRLSPNVQVSWRSADWISAAVAQGNQLVVIYWVPGAIMSSSIALAAPALSPSVLPAATGSPNASLSVATPTAVARPTVRANTAITPSVETAPMGEFVRSNDTFIFAGVLPVLLLIGIVVWRTVRQGMA